MRAKLLLTACFLPLLLLPAPAFAGKNDDPIQVKKNFSAGSGQNVGGDRERGSLFDFFKSKRRIVIDDVPMDGPVISNVNPDQGFDVYRPEPLMALAQGALGARRARPRCTRDSSVSVTASAAPPTGSAPASPPRVHSQAWCAHSPRGARQAARWQAGEQ